MPSLNQEIQFQGTKCDKITINDENFGMVQNSLNVGHFLADEAEISKFVSIGSFHQVLS